MNNDSARLTPGKSNNYLMRNSFYVLISIIFLHLHVTHIPIHASDSLVFFHELTYHSEFEAGAFHEFHFPNQSDYLKIALAVDPESDSSIVKMARNQIHDIESYLLKKNIRKKNQKKQVKLIYKTVHDRLFKKYEEKILFDKIFKKGLYNCVTASILYTMIFERFNIPCEIKMSSNHVYLYAFPSTESILVEATNPVEGYLEYDSRFKENYVKYLLENKIISEEEFAGSNIHDLFKSYYFREETISLKELAGLQYLNSGAYMIDEDEYRNAYSLLEKAYYLYPHEKVEFMMLMAATNIIEGSDYSNIEDTKYLYKLSRFDSYIKKEQIIGEFNRITHKLLIDKGMTATYDSIFGLLQKHITDSTAHAEISFMYYYERGRILFTKTEIDESIQYLGRAYNIKSKNANIEALLIGAIATILQNEQDPVVINDTLQSFIQKYPALEKTKAFSQMLLINKLSMMAYYFSEKKPEKAIHCQTYFENHYFPEQGMNMLEQPIVSAYSSGAVYYFRQGNYSKTRNILEQGLEYVPESSELKRRLRAIR